MSEINGIPDLMGALKKHANLGDVKEIVRRNGSEMHESTMRYAPVDTGFLKRHIIFEIQDGGYTAYVASTASYAKYQEWGTRFQSGTAHMKPAFFKQRGPFINDLSRVIERGG